jgi:hypothetical protein
MVGKRGALLEAPPVAPEPPPASDLPVEAAAAAPSEPAAPAEPAPEPRGLAHTLGRVRQVVAGIDAEELAAVRVRLAREVERLEAFERTLDRALAIKRALPS